MEKTKYYTPEITEFYVGFEFEFSGLDGYWRPYPFEKQTIKNKKESEVNNGLFTLDWVQKIFEDNYRMLSQRIRVKYLDKEDIESLGFVHDVGLVYNLPNTDFSLWVDFTNSFEYSVVVRKKVNSSLFNFAIFPAKNKSELKRLLTQIGVL